MQTSSLSDTALRADQHKRKKFSLKSVLLAILILGLMGVAAFFSYSYYQTRQQVLDLKTLEGQQQLAEQELSGLLNQLGKLMLLPEDEEPTVATVTDVEALSQEQPFFARANNGDKVIIYVDERKAIIYSPERNIIVNVGTLLVDVDNEQTYEQQEDLSVENNEISESEDEIDLEEESNTEDTE